MQNILAYALEKSSMNFYFNLKMEVSYKQVLEEIAKRKEYFKALYADKFSGKHLIFEIGCGHGHFLSSYAQIQPLRTFVGVDLCTRRINQANKKREKVNLDNLYFVKAEANEFIESLPHNTFLDQIFVLFPDPWPKNRHHKNRLVQQNFLELLAQKSLEGATLYLRTDHGMYFEWAKKAIDKSPFWQIGDKLWPFEQETVFQKKMQCYQSLVAVRI